MRASTLLVLALIASIDLIIWLAAHMTGHAGEPAWLAYNLFGLIAVLLIAFAASLLFVFRLAREGEQKPIPRFQAYVRDQGPRLIFSLLAMQLIATSAAFFTALKASIPSIQPFYADPALAQFGRWLFGMDAWRLFPEWFVRLVDPIYMTWVVVQLVVLGLVTLMKPSPRRETALISFPLIWLFLGFVGALAGSSVGPIYYDQFYHSDQFADLGKRLAGTMSEHGRDYLLSSSQGIGSGISAMPSLHIAVTFWMVMVAWRTRLFVPACLYLALMFTGSLALGWHYSLDGLVGIYGSLLIFTACRPVGRAAFADLPIQRMPLLSNSWVSVGK